MARNRTLLQLRTEVRERSDMVNSDFVTDNEVDRYLNESISELYDMLIGVQGQEWYVKTYEFTTVAGQEDYLIPAVHPVTNVPVNFYLLLGVDLNVGGPTPVPLRPYMMNERHNRGIFYTGGFPYGRERMRYRMSGVVADIGTVGDYNHQITLKPAPAGAQTVTLLYIPHAPTLVANTDVWDGFNGWEEYAIVDAAIKCLEKEESSTIAQERRKERLIQRIQGLGSAHDDSFPERVTDATRRWPYYYDYNG